ncbi:MAG TPA: Uma2 family endonuclease [Candidatus Binatia bacterium]|nr:Uma2 family endonuclease [Candidatus Binatia bacterium]
MSGVAASGRHDVAEYFALAECGVISPDDHVELLDGLIVAMSPQAPLHAATVYHVEHLLLRKLAPHLLVRVQMPFVASATSAPEPDICVVSGPPQRYVDRHPSSAVLVVEVSDTTLIQDRITKASIYAAAAVPWYWIVNVREHCVECFTRPDAEARRYADLVRAAGATILPLPSLSTEIAADDLFPRTP